MTWPSHQGARVGAMRDPKGWRHRQRARSVSTPRPRTSRPLLLARQTGSNVRKQDHLI